MAIGRRDRRVDPDPPNSLIASAARVTLKRADIWKDYKLRDEEWQSECWRMYDVIGELHFAANYIGSGCSRVRIYVAEVDEVGRIGEEVDDDEEVQALADTAFGGPAAKAEALRSLGINLTVPGEAFIIGRAKRSDAEQDRWFVTTNSEIRRQGGMLIVDTGNGKEEINPERDIVIRVWTPHPRRMRLADSPTRAALPVLREIEQLTKYVFSQIDSRLAGAGLLPIPSGLDFPHGDDQAGGAEGLMQALTDAASASLSGHGSAAALVPILVEMPIDAINAMPDKPIRFESELSERAKDLRDEALRRLSLALDMPPEVLTGTGDTNHWCMDESTQVYTAGGWRGIDDVQPGTLVLSMDHETGLTEWRNVTDLYVADVIDEPMLAIEGRYHSSLTTMGHRWPVLRKRGRAATWEREWVYSRDIAASAANTTGNGPLNVQIPRAALCGQLPTEAKYTDALVELVGWTVTEGGLSYRDGASLPHRFAIYQSHKANPDNCSRIRAALTSLYGPARQDSKVGRPTRVEEDWAWWREVREGDRTRFVLSKAAWLPILEHCPHRMLSTDFVNELTHSQLLLLIDTAVRGDGHRLGGKTRLIGQKDPAMLDGLEHAAILAGLAVNRYSQEHDGFHLHTQHYLSLSERVHYRPRANTVSVQPYTGRVWCPTVPPTHSVLARRSGASFWTGQSAWHIEESAVKIHIEPLMNRICHALTEAYLAPALKALKKDPKKYAFWFDTAPLTVRPDRLKDTLMLFEQGVVNAEAVLRAGNYNPSIDAPTEEEEAARYIKELMLRDPTLFQIEGIREAAGIKGIETAIPLAELPPGQGDLNAPGPPPPPAPDKAIDNGQTAPMPDRPTGTGSNGSGLIASVEYVEPPSAILVAADALVSSALDRAGKRLLTREHRAQWKDVPAFELHTKIRVQGREHVEKLMDGAWERLPAMFQDIPVDRDKIRDVLDRYCTIMLVRSMPHHRSTLAAMLRDHGLIR